MIHKIKAEIERLKAWQPIASPSLDKLCSFLDSLQEEPVDKCNGCNNVKGCITCVDGSEWAHLKEASKNYADKEKFRKEVEKLKSNLIYGACSSQIAMETICKKEAFNEVLAILDSLQEEPVSEDLQEVAKVYADNITDKIGYKLQLRRAVVYGAKWQKTHLWKPADGDDLPEYEREVVVFTQNYPDDAGMMMVAIGHRPTPDGYDGKSLTTGEIEHYTPKTYDKGGWNIPDVKYWLDVELPKEIEL